MKPSFIAVCVLALTGVAAPLAAAPESSNEEAARPPSSVTEEAVMSKVRFLASERLEGRQSGTSAYDRAAAWAVVTMRRAGLEPAGPGGEWLAPLEVESNAIERCRLGVSAPASKVRSAAGTGADGETAASIDWLEWGDDFVCRGFTGSGRVTAPVVFAGYGISRPDLGYDDYEGVDVNGKIVLAFKGKPDWTPEQGSWDQDHLPRRRANAAREHGALGLLLVNTPDDWQTSPIGSVLHGPGEHPGDVPQLHVSMEVARRILGVEEGWLAERRVEIDEAHEPRSGETGSPVSVDVAARYSPDARTASVVGMIPAKAGEKSRAEEFVVLGAHLDHVGPQGEGGLFPGANDNASGAAVVLSVAEALAAREQRPKRNVVFVLFAAEESGLHGAKAFVEQEVVPPDRITGMINLDCVGYGKRLRMGGGESAPKLWQLAREVDAAAAGITVEGTWWGGGADATPFFEAGVPTLYLAAKDSYTHLHQPSDTPETLNGPLLAEIARHTYRVVAAVADGRYEREELQPKPES